MLYRHSSAELIVHAPMALSDVFSLIRSVAVGGRHEGVNTTYVFPRNNLQRYGQLILCALSLTYQLLSCMHYPYVYGVIMCGLRLGQIVFLVLCYLTVCTAASQSGLSACTTQHSVSASAKCLTTAVRQQRCTMLLYALLPVGQLLIFLDHKSQLRPSHFVR